MKHFCILFLIGLLPYSILAQFEAGLQLGTSNYLGDLAPSGLWASMGETHLSAGVLARYNFGKWVSVRGAFTYGKISSEDAASRSASRKSRNLSFRSNIYEFALIGEFNILGYKPYNLERVVSPYIFAGVAGYGFNPQAEYEGAWVDLQPLGTEGQGMAGEPAPYSRFQLSLPLGIGIKYAINDLWNIGFEVGYRKTFTDHLDDVSGNYPDLAQLALENGELAAELSWRGDEVNPDSNPNPPAAGSGRGDSDNLDAYVFSGIFVTYNFTDNGLVGSRGRRRGKSGCPTF